MLNLVSDTGGAQAASGDYVPPARPRPLAPRLTPAEAEAHAAFIAGLGEDTLW